MTHVEAEHMFAAALAAHPKGELGKLHEKLAGRLNLFPVGMRREALSIAKPLFRLVEYYEARNSEMPLLAEIFDRGERGLSVEAQLLRLDTYWERVCDYIRSLGPHPSSVTVPRSSGRPAWDGPQTSAADAPTLTKPEGSTSSGPSRTQRRTP